MNNLVSLGKVYVDTPSRRTVFHTWLEGHLKPLWAALEGKNIDAADVEGVRLRDRVRRLLAFEIRAQSFLKRGREVLLDMLNKPSETWTSEQREWFGIGALTAELNTWQRMTTRLKSESNSTNRGLLVRAIGGSPRKEKRADARRRFTQGIIPAQDFWLVASGLGWRDRDERWHWVQSSMPELEKTLTEGGFSALPWLASGYCDTAKIDEMHAVFSPLLNAHPAMTRSLALAKESVNECIRLRTLWKGQFESILAK